jgi:ABC-type amino acid transport system permease subunit
LLVIVGQQAVIQLSDPLGTGANWLGTGGRAADPLLAGATTTAVIQVSAVVVGHVLGVVLAHDRAVALLPRRHAVLGQIPLLVLMVAYTVTGLVLLFAA